MPNRLYLITGVNDVEGKRNAYAAAPGPSARAAFKAFKAMLAARGEGDELRERNKRLTFGDVYVDEVPRVATVLYDGHTPQFE